MPLDKSRSMVDENTTYRQWIGVRQASKESVDEYIHSMSEWFRTEYKLTANADSSNIRKAVCAMANSKGGELFIGIDNNTHQCIGTNLTVETVSNYLEQIEAPRSEWFESNLRNVVKFLTQVSLNREGMSVFILEVIPIGVPIGVLEQGKLELYVREGESTKHKNSFEALTWNRMASREKILRNCYVEFVTIVQRLINVIPQGSLGMGIKFPFLEKCMEDGTFYRDLTNKDRAILLGGKIDGSQKRGIYYRTFHLKFMIDHIYKVHFGKSPQVILEKLVEEVQQYESQRDDNIRDFKNFLIEEGIKME